MSEEEDRDLIESVQIETHMALRSERMTGRIEGILLVGMPLLVMLLWALLRTHWVF